MAKGGSGGRGRGRQQGWWKGEWEGEIACDICKATSISRHIRCSERRSREPLLFGGIVGVGVGGWVNGAWVNGWVLG